MIIEHREDTMARPKKPEGEKFIRQDISMEPEQFKRLQEVCQELDRPMSWVIRQALAAYLMCSNTQ